MNLMMLTPDDASSNQTLFERTTPLKTAVGSTIETEDCEIAKTSNIEEAAKVVLNRMKNTLADELRKMIAPTIETV